VESVFSVWLISTDVVRATGISAGDVTATLQRLSLIGQGELPSVR